MVEIHEEMKSPGKMCFSLSLFFFPKMVPFHRNVYDFVEGDGRKTVFPWQFATMFSQQL